MDQVAANAGALLGTSRPRTRPYPRLPFEWRAIRSVLGI